jgi:hypothetical protein
LPLFATAKFTQCRKKPIFRLFVGSATGAHGGNPPFRVFAVLSGGDVKVTGPEGEVRVW